MAKRIRGTRRKTVWAVLFAAAVILLCAAACAEGTQCVDSDGIIREGHHWIVSVVTPPTCQTDGNTLYYCTQCGNYYTGDVIPAGEQYHSWYCIDDGPDTHHRECSYCGDKKASEPHNWSAWYTSSEAFAAKYGMVFPGGQLKAPTCTEDGIQGRYCPDCGYTQTAKVAAGHKPVEDAAVAATCEQPGKTAGSHCAVCGAVIDEQKEVPATGHSYGEPAWTWAGKTAAAAFICSTCGKSVTVGASVSENKEADGVRLRATVSLDGKSYEDELIYKDKGKEETDKKEEEAVAPSNDSGDTVQADEQETQPAVNVKGKIQSTVAKVKKEFKASKEVTKKIKIIIPEEKSKLKTIGKDSFQKISKSDVHLIKQPKIYKTQIQELKKISTKQAFKKITAIFQTELKKQEETTDADQNDADDAVTESEEDGQALPDAVESQGQEQPSEDNLSGLLEQLKTAYPEVDFSALEEGGDQSGIVVLDVSKLGMTPEEFFALDPREQANIIDYQLNKSSKLTEAQLAALEDKNVSGPEQRVPTEKPESKVSDFTTGQIILLPLNPKEGTDGKNHIVWYVHPDGVLQPPPLGYSDGTITRSEEDGQALQDAVESESLEQFNLEIISDESDQSEDAMNKFASEDAMNNLASEDAINNPALLLAGLEDAIYNPASKPENKPWTKLEDAMNNLASEDVLYPPASEFVKAPWTESEDVMLNPVSFPQIQPEINSDEPWIIDGSESKYSEYDNEFEKFYDALDDRKEQDKDDKSLYDLLGDIEGQGMDDKSHWTKDKSTLLETIMTFSLDSYATTDEDEEALAQQIIERLDKIVYDDKK